MTPIKHIYKMLLICAFHMTISIAYGMTLQNNSDINLEKLFVHGSDNILQNTNLQNYSFIINPTGTPIDGKVGLTQTTINIYPTNDCSGTPSATQLSQASSPIWTPKPGEQNYISNSTMFNFSSNNATAVSNMNSAKFVGTLSTDQTFSKCFGGKLTDSNGNQCSSNSCGFINNSDPGLLTNNVNITLFSCISDPLTNNKCGCLQQNDGSSKPLIWYIDSRNPFLLTCYITSRTIGATICNTYINTSGNGFNDSASTGHCGYNAGWRIPTAAGITSGSYFNSSSFSNSNASDIGRLGYFVINNLINSYIPGDNVNTFATWLSKTNVTDSNYKYIQNGSNDGPQGLQAGAYEISGPNNVNWFMNATLGNVGPISNANNILPVHDGGQ